MPAINSLIRRAPWLPPMTSSTGASAFNPSAARAAAGGVHAKFRPHRHAGDFDPARAQTLPGLRKIDKGPVHPRRQPAVGASGDGVGFVQKGPRAQAFAGQEGRRGGEAAHGQHHPGGRPRKV